MCRSAVIATCGLFATAFRSASVRYAVSSLTSRSGERLDGIVLVLLRLGSLAADRDDGALDGGCRRLSGIAVGLWAAIDVHGGWRLVLGPDVAAIDRELAIRVDADEDAGAGDLGGVVADRPILEGGERRLDFAEARDRPRRAVRRRSRIRLRAWRTRPSSASIVACSSAVRSVGVPSSSRRRWVWPNGKSTATSIHFQPSAAIFSASAFSFSATRPSSRADILAASRHRPAGTDRA